MRAVGIRMLDLTREPPCPSFWGTNYSALHYYNPPPREGAAFEAFLIFHMGKWVPD